MYNPRPMIPDMEYFSEGDRVYIRINNELLKFILLNKADGEDIKSYLHRILNPITVEKAIRHLDLDD